MAKERHKASTDQGIDARPDPSWLLVPLMKRWRIVVAISILSAIATGVASLFLTPRYVASVSFVPATDDGAPAAASLGGLATQFGLSLGATRTNESPQFYVELSRSRRILERILLAQYSVPEQFHATLGDSATLLSILDIGPEDPLERLEAGLDYLERVVQRRIDNATGILTFVVPGPSPQLAATLANRFIEELSTFNRDVRQSHARARREFLDGAVKRAESSLAAVEDSLLQFLEDNRSFSQSPALTFVNGRLLRRVSLAQEAYLNYQRNRELAQMEEIDTRPMITVIDVGVPPAKRSWPRRKILVATALVLGGLLGVAVVLVMEYYPQTRSLVSSPGSPSGGAAPTS